MGASIGRVAVVKKAHYAKAGIDNIIPFLLTAGGGMGGPANDFVCELVTAYTKDLRDQSSFHRSFMGRISVIMLKHAYSMAQTCLRLRMDLSTDTIPDTYNYDAE